jgi:signal transduction histidine kinase/DNA-binding response OmpR family regulator
VSELDGLKLLRRIEEGVAGKTGDEFFRQIVRDIAGALNAHAAFASRLAPGRRAVMLAFWLGDRFDECLEYSLAGTPCEFVYNGEITCFARDIGNVFPVDRKWFENLGVNSYLGIPVQGETGEVVGHLAVMDKPERDWRDADVDILRLFSLRTAVELERDRAHRALEHANQTLKQMNEQLQREVTQRIAMERELVAAKAAAESANQAKSAFISQMSHELRTPLNGILGYAQLLRRDGAALTPQQRDGLQVIERSGEHLLNLVNDLLDLAKIEAGKLELRNEAVALHELLEHVANLIRVRADRAGLDFTFESAQSLPTHVRGDSRALRQVLLNLLGNAIKFTNHGGCVSLRARSAARGAGGHTVSFEVQDSGVGIGADQLQRIFEPFHRIENPGRTAEGTGLGLAITRRLVEAMGGTIGVKSSPGEGSMFSVALELEAAASESLRDVLRTDIIGYEGEQRSVLVVDDDPNNRELVRQLLAGLGFDVRVAENGRDALRLLSARRPSLVITDLVMPQLDGMRFVRELRAGDRANRLPVIAMSASASDNTSHEALSAGCDAFLSKPMRLADLLDWIERLLGLRWRRAESPRQPGAVQSAIDAFRIDPLTATDLNHLAMLGDIDGLMHRANDAFESNPAAQSFYTELRALADQYDTGAIRRLLAEFSPQKN